MTNHTESRNFKPANPDCAQCDGWGVIIEDEGDFPTERNCSCIQRTREEIAEWDANHS